MPVKINYSKKSFNKSSSNLILFSNENLILAGYERRFQALNFPIKIY